MSYRELPEDMSSYVRELERDARDLLSEIRMIDNPNLGKGKEMYEAAERLRVPYAGLRQSAFSYQMRNREREVFYTALFLYLGGEFVQKESHEPPQ